MKKIIALWAIPRSVSTAFERMMMQRGDLKVLHEPFSESFYFSADAPSDRYTDVSEKPRKDFRLVLDQIFKIAQTRPVFFKDMAYHMNGRAEREILVHLESTFIIRDPAQALPSLHHLWPDFSLEETGYEQQYRLFKKVSAIKDAPPVVVDAKDLIGRPERCVRAYCEAVGLAFMPEALEWESGERKEWKLWRKWHKDAAKSRGFERRRNSQYLSIEEDERLSRAYEICRPFYEEMYRNRLQPSDSSTARENGGSKKSVQAGSR